MDGRRHVIVCGVDGSTASEHALEWAIGEATRRRCSLRVVTAWSWDGLEAIGAASSPSAALRHARDIQDAALARASVTAENAPDVERLISRGGPSETLCTAAADAELVVLGSHGHGAVHDKLVGSTSQRVIHHAPCPVVVLPDPRHVEKQIKRAKSRHRGANTPRSAPMF